MIFRDKKEEELGEFGVFTNLDKTMVIQDAQVFNETPLNYRKCSLVLAKLLYLLYQSEPITPKEATNMFFASTKAFQCKDSGLRRLVYLVIKELANVAQDVIMVTSSLIQDIISKDSDTAMFRANALRALGKVMEASTIVGDERYFKQAFVDRNPNVVSSAIVTAVHHFVDNKDVVKRWVAEIQQALNGAASKSITQYHALGLLYLIKQNDKMALTKLIQQMNKSSVNPMATCLFLRIYAQLLTIDQATMANPIDLKPFLRQSGPKSEMIGIEAARIICERCNDVYANDIVYAVTALQMFLGSSKIIVKFAALRILNELASKCPQKVVTCNQDIETLITHPNRNIATLAITALLKTGDESSVDRLVKQIRSYVGEITDEFKVIVVDAVRALCLKFPAKYEGMLDFLGSILRDEGAYTYKQATVNAICQIIEKIPGTRDIALIHLCEFIEDSEYPDLTIQILHVLGSQGPLVNQPSKLIRYIYNRLVLEDAPVRVAAVGALTKFAIKLASLKLGIVSILKRCLNDVDDDVRDRAIISLQGMERSPSYFSDVVVPDLEALEHQLIEYTQSKNMFISPFDISDVPTLEESDLFEQAKAARSEQIVPSAAASPTANDQSADHHQIIDGFALIKEIPEFASYGSLFKSSPLLPLTEPDTEYSVMVRKHVFAKNVILEFVCSNTVPGLLLSDVSVSVKSSALKPLLSLPIPVLVYNQTLSSFVSFEKLPGIIDGSFEATLCFRSQECNSETNEPLEDGYQDKYGLEAFELGLVDYLKDRPVYNFDSDWASLPKEAVQTFALPSLQSIQEAVKAVLDLFGVLPIPGTANVDPNNPVHTLLMCGTMEEHGDFAIRCRFAMSRAGVNIELAIKAAQKDSISLLMNSFS